MSPPPLFEKQINTPPCQLCNTETRILICDRDRSGESLSTVMCDGCGLVHHHPIPTVSEIAEFYRTEYRQSYKGITRPKLKHILRAATGAGNLRKKLENHLPRGAKGLDFGSGPGVFCAVMQHNGYEMTAIEPHQGYADYSKKEFSLNVLNDIWENISFQQPFDFVVANHVVEHLQNPFQALCAIHAWLKPGGIFFVEVPDILEYMQRKSYYGCFHYGHIFNFSPQTLRTILHKAGFSVVEDTQASADSLSTSLMMKKTHETDSSFFIKDVDHAQHVLASAKLAFARTTVKTPIYMLGRIRKLFDRTARGIREFNVVRRYQSPQSIVKQFG